MGKRSPVKQSPRGGPTDFKMITVDDFIALEPPKNPATLQRMRTNMVKQSRAKENCMVCDQPAWKLAGSGLCFPCTTGESDASQDYELIEEPK